LSLGELARPNRGGWSERNELVDAIDQLGREALTRGLHDEHRVGRQPLLDVLDRCSRLSPEQAAAMIRQQTSSANSVRRFSNSTRGL
jgi:hypothetical protein